MKLDKNKAFVMFSEFDSAAAAKFLEALVDGYHTVVINSEGGNVAAGFAVYDLMMANEQSYTTIGVGQVQSIAILPFLAGDYRVCTKNCRFMIHHGTFDTVEPQAMKEMKGAIEELEAQDEAYQQIIWERTNLKANEVRKLIKFGFYFDANEALRLGFVHKIL